MEEGEGEYFNYVEDGFVIGVVMLYNEYIIE